MLNQIKALLSDTQLRQQLKEVTSMAEAIALIKTAGITKGYQFSSDGISQLFQHQLEPLELGEAELLMVSGGANIPTINCAPTKVKTHICCE